MHASMGSGVWAEAPHSRLTAESNLFSREPHWIKNPRHQSEGGESVWEVDYGPGATANDWIPIPTTMAITPMR
jgi:hypothetical protein